MKKRFVNPNYISVYKESNNSSLQRMIRSLYLQIDRINDPVMDERNYDLVVIANKLVSCSAQLQRETGTHLISKFLKTDTEKVSFTLELYDLFNEAYANTVIDGYTVAAK